MRAKTKGGLGRHIRVLTAGLSFIGLCGFGSSQSECANPDAVQSYKRQFSEVVGYEQNLDVASLLKALRVSVTGQTSDEQKLHFRCTASVSVGSSSTTLHYLLTLSPDRKGFKVVPEMKPHTSATVLDCKKTRDTNDQLVCSSPELLSKDVELARLYNKDRAEAVANDGNVEMIDLYPRDWGNERRACGTDTACTSSFYDQKITMIKVLFGDVPRWPYYLTIIAAGWIALGFYSVPLIIAFARKHPKRWRISMLNLLAGWTIIGWIAAFIWALRRLAKPENTEKAVA